MATTITDKAGLQAMKDTLDGDFVLGANIDASGTGSGFEPVGASGTEFTGTFVGTGYTITDLFIDRDTTDYVGLFGYAVGATITDCVLTGIDVTGDDKVGGCIGYAEGCTITGSSVTGSITGGTQTGGFVGVGYGNTITSCHSTVTITSDADYVAGFIAYSYDDDITSCYATGNVTTTNQTNVGGFIGEMWGGDILKCYATGDVTAGDATYAWGAYGVGGFAGHTRAIGTDGGTISKCYATGDVICIEGTTYETTGNGGFVGQLNDTAVSNCYARGAVTSHDAGGFAGTNDGTIDKCYATGLVTGDADCGGLVGDSGWTAATNSYWDTETTGQATSDSGTGKTTAQMLVITTYTSWDFTTIWNINPENNSGYPYFRWEYDAETRCVCIPDLFDEKGRVPKGARVRAFRADTHAEITAAETVIDAKGNATVCSLPMDTDVSFHVTWGGSSSTGKGKWLYSDIKGINEGGTGASDVYNARSNMGLGSEDSPQFTAVELGHATDTTITRVSAAKVAVEGAVLVRPANYVVAANGAPTHVKAQADYVCDATDDHVQIQAAIDALPATGGKVLLTEGTFNIETTITLDSYQTLRGMGRSTILTTTTADVDIITATGSSGSEKTGITLADFCIDGDAGSATNDGGISWEYVDYSKIFNVWSQDNGEDGIYLDFCDNNIVSGCTCNSNGDSGIWLNEACSGNIIVGNTCSSNPAGGIYLQAGVNDNNAINSNTCKDSTNYGIYIASGTKNSVRGNTCTGNTNGPGINLDQSDESCVSGNVCEGNYSGIYVDDSENISVVGNVCSENTYYGIHLSSTVYAYSTCNSNVCHKNGRHGIFNDTNGEMAIVGNTCAENSQTTTNTYDDIYIECADYVLLSNNVCRAGQETNKPRYGINIAATSTGIKVINNDLYDDGFGTGPYNDDGTGTIYLPATGVGIADDQIVQVDGSPAASSLARWTANGLEGQVQTGTIFPTSPAPTTGQLFCHAPTGRIIFYKYNGSSWNAILSLGTMTLYVDKTDGTDQLTDHGTGVDGDAFATVQYAVDCIPGSYSGNVTININDEDYDETVTIRGKNSTGDYTITLQGTLAQQDTATMDSAVQGTGATQGSITDTGKFAAFANMLIYANSEYRVIDSVTANTATIAGCFSGAPSGTWIVYDWDTSINSIVVNGGQQGVKLYDLYLDTSTALTREDNATIDLYRCKLSTTGTFTAILRDGTTYLYYCYVQSSGQAVYDEMGTTRLYYTKVYTATTNDRCIRATMLGKIYLRAGTILDAASKDTTYGVYAENGSQVSCYSSAAEGYVRIRNQNIGIRAQTGAQGAITANIQYAGNNTTESADAASFGYID